MWRRLNSEVYLYVVDTYVSTLKTDIMELSFEVFQFNKLGPMTVVTSAQKRNQLGHYQIKYPLQDYSDTNETCSKETLLYVGFVASLSLK